MLGVQFVKSPDYIQVTGFMDQTKINMVRGDAGGEMDPHGADLVCLVQYEIRFGDVVQDVQLVSHDWSGERSAGLPALELEAVGRSALRLIDMSI